MLNQLPKNSEGDQVFAMFLDKENNMGEAVVEASFSEIKDDWANDCEEGKLTVDVLQTEDKIIVVAPMAGAKNDCIEVYIHNDLLTIRGVREAPIDIAYEVNYYYQECFWGKFSRTIVLPVDVKGNSARAEFKNGVLKVIIQKKRNDTKIPVTIVEE